MIMGESWDISGGYGICLTIEFRGKPLTPVIYHDFPSFSHIFPMTLPQLGVYPISRIAHIISGLAPCTCTISNSEKKCITVDQTDVGNAFVEAFPCRIPFAG
jgi:hypothetical protein